MNDFFESFKGKPKHDHKVRVVHFKKEPYDIYIGRLPKGKYNKWAYPKELKESLPPTATRKEIIQAYEDYLLSNEELLNDICELKDKVLGCWCKNEGGGGKSCHGDILAKWVKKLCN